MDLIAKIPAWGWECFGISILLIIIYIVVISFWYKDIIVSEKVTGALIDGEQIYFLPAASVTLNATAKVAVARDLSGNFVAAKVYELSFTPLIQLQGEEDQLYVIKYNRTWVASDDIRLTTGTSGLLESIAVTTEDRISAIISQVTDAPKKVLAAGAGAAAIAPPAGLPVTITNIQPVTKSFVLSPDMLGKALNVCLWEISIDELSSGGLNLIDASFEIRIPKPAVSPVIAAGRSGKKIGGILSRPLRNFKMTFHVNQTQDINNRIYNTNADAEVELMIPDPSKSLLVPFKRTLFSKSVQSPKFSSGLLTENYLNKPSELENLVSIPINIGKAIFSIPAQLLSFKITRLQQQTSFDTESQKLIAAKLLLDKSQKDSGAQSQKSNNDAVKAGLDAQKTSLDLQKDLLTTQQALINTKKDLQDLLTKIEAEKKK
jgi:hypothetical protein